MQHEITAANLFGHTSGFVRLPSETGQINTEMNFRDFMLLNQRLYCSEAIENNPNWDIKTTEHSELDIMDSTSLMVFDVAISFEDHDIHEFKESKDGETFFDELLMVASKSEKRGVRGKRAAMLTQFELKQNDKGEDELQAKLIISKTVWYNDYRATLNYPDVDNPMEVKDLENELLNRMRAWVDSVDHRSFISITHLC